MNWDDIKNDARGRSFVDSLAGCKLAKQSLLEEILEETDDPFGKHALLWITKSACPTWPLRQRQRWPVSKRVAPCSRVYDVVIKISQFFRGVEMLLILTPIRTAILEASWSVPNVASNDLQSQLPPLCLWGLFFLHQVLCLLPLVSIATLVALCRRGCRWQKRRHDDGDSGVNSVGSTREEVAENHGDSRW